LPDGHSTFVSHGTAVILAPVGSPNWVTARLAAFEAADLQGRNELARHIATRVQSDREFLQGTQGGDTPPPIVSQIRSELSNAERLRTLTGLALDNAIRHYDTGWDGTGKSEEQRRAEVVRLYSAVRENVAAHAAVLASGAITPVQFEGLDADGKLAVLVGMVWSDRLQRLAESLWSPDLIVQPGLGGQSIANRIDAESQRDPAWLTATNGIRVWQDENGEKVLVSFGAAPATTLSSLDRSHARDRALAALQHFVGEQIESASEGGTALTYQETTGGKAATFDSGRYEERISAHSREVTISGAEQVYEWRGQHPFGRANMQVVVLAWSPSRNASARATGAALSREAERMRREGAAPAPALRTDDNVSAPPAASAVPTRPGARSDSGDY